jgi:predicted dienelactone hydrolase
MNRLLSRRRVCAALAGVALLPRIALAQVDDGAGFNSIDFDWFDSPRQRHVPVRLHLPRSRDGAMPLMVFSHGLGGSRNGYSYLGRHCASRGVASLHLQHVGSDRALWSGSVFGLASRLQNAAAEGEAVARAHDLRFALDQLLAGEWAERIDPERIVAAGHSYGANTALLAVGARVQREGRTVALRDERVRAAVLISAPPFYGEALPEQILAPITVPTLHITATEDVIRVPGYYSGAQDRLAVFDAIGSPRKWLAVFAGGSHSMFTDRAGTGGALLNPQVKAATQGLTMAFLQAVLQGDPSALAVWPQQHAALVARFDARGPST